MNRSPGQDEWHARVKQGIHDGFVSKALRDEALEWTAKVAPDKRAWARQWVRGTRRRTSEIQSFIDRMKAAEGQA